jgi:hypothetical protein
MQIFLLPLRRYYSPMQIFLLPLRRYYSPMQIFLLSLRRYYSPMQIFVPLMHFSQSALFFDISSQFCFLASAAV